MAICPKHPGVRPGNQPEGRGLCPLCLVEDWDAVHVHHCPDCFEDWECADADCEPGEQERLCNHCRQAYWR